MKRVEKDMPAAGTPTGGNGKGMIDSSVLTTIRNKALGLVGVVGLNFSDLEDIEQELILFLLERMEKFDSGKAKWTTFVLRIIERGITEIIRSRQASCRDYRRCQVSLDQLVEIEEGLFVPLWETIPENDFALVQERQDLSIDLESVIPFLPPGLRPWFESLKSTSIREVSRCAGISMSYIHRCLRKARARLERAALEEYLNTCRRSNP